MPAASSRCCAWAWPISYKKRSFERSDTFAWGGRVAAVLTAVALTVCCAVLVWCFFSGDNTIQYVLDNRSTSTAPEAWLYKLAGLWAGRQGSLLFWAWLIAVFNAVLVFATRKNARPLDNGALAISSLVLTAFVSVLLFSEGNMPFIVTDSRYFGDDGTLSVMASARSMNALLEHWAMAIHPPTLFIGYAGLTIPFAYAISALIVNDDSTEWVNRSTPYLMFSWLLLGIGIGLGAVWAYVVLGWGGYWGWIRWRTPVCSLARGCGAHPLVRSVPPARRFQALERVLRLPHLLLRGAGHLHHPFGPRAVGARLRGRPSFARHVRRAHHLLASGRHRGPYRAPQELRCDGCGR
ncbi:MAG: cytochrome c biogenesis protein CcsA [Adlercreutzia equolifaciens]